MVVTTESWLPAADGFKLFVRRIKPRAQVAKAKLIFLHGYDHHSGLYDEFYRFLAGDQIEVVAYDLRGFGRSIDANVAAGDSGPTTTTLDDLSAVVAYELVTGGSVFLMGHSMGAAIMFTYSCLGPEHLVNQIAGWLGEAPDFGLPLDAPTRPSAAKLAILRAVHFFVPRLTITVKLDPKLLSRDQAVQKAYAEDPLVTHCWTLEGALAHLERTGKLANGEYIPLQHVQNVWIGHGTMDQCTSFAKARDWFKSLEIQDKLFHEYVGWSHNLHAEPEGDKRVFANDVSSWILRHVLPQ